jgi:hypothetical protein
LHTVSKPGKQIAYLGADMKPTMVTTDSDVHST